MTTYSMKTIYANTKIRDAHNTTGNVLTSVNANVTVTGNELFTATMQLSNSGGVYQQPGDKWVKVTYNGYTGWMAFVHMGGFICNNFIETPDAPIEEVVPPKSCVWIPQETGHPLDGRKFLYEFVKEL